MNKDRTLRTLWAIPLVGFVLLAALPAHAAPAVRDEPIVTAAIHGGSASFAPRISAEGMTLTVAGKGHMLSQRVSSGQTATFSPVDSEGYALPDGIYKWEAVMMPRPQDLKPSAFRNGQVSRDGRAVEAPEAPRGQRQSGVFSIKNGAFVDSSLVETESGRAAANLAPEATEAPSAAARDAEHSDRDGN